MCVKFYKLSKPKPENNTTYVDASCDKTVAEINSIDPCLLVAGDGTTEEDSGSVHGSMRTAYKVFKQITYSLNKSYV